jgi:hypothetical protein
VAAATVLIASVLQGPPSRLPGVALGWPLLLYLERAGLIASLMVGFGGVGLRLLAGARVASAGGGPLPVLDVEDATDSAAALKEGVDADVTDLSAHLLDVERRVEKLETRRWSDERE